PAAAYRVEQFQIGYRAVLGFVDDDFGESRVQRVEYVQWGAPKVAVCLASNLVACEVAALEPVVSTLDRGGDPPRPSERRVGDGSSGSGLGVGHGDDFCECRGAQLEVEGRERHRAVADFGFRVRQMTPRLDASCDLRVGQVW